ncbi:MAG: addiction module protein [Opitutaceae bacterium]|nr:addiction module protein [Opitutaceae bacterium]
MSTAMELESALERLPTGEQEKFAIWYEQRLSQTLPDEDVARTWEIEAERRLAEIRSGAVTPVPGEQVMGEIRRRYGL